jgi:spermidine synthase
MSIEGAPWYLFQLDLARCFWAVFPGALLWGASFPLALASLATRGQDTGRLVGGVYAANTVGAIIGALAFSMLLVPHLGTQGAQQLLVVLCVISAIVAVAPLFSSDEEGAGAAKGLLAMAVTGAMLVAGFLAWTVGAPNWGAVAWGRNSASNMPDNFPPVLDERNNGEVTLVREAAQRGLARLRLANGKLAYDPTSDDNNSWIAAHHDKLVTVLNKRQALTGIGSLLAYGDQTSPSRYCAFIGEGMNVSVAVTYDSDGFRYFHGAGKVQASSNPEDMRLQRMLGHISALTKPDSKDVLVVACGAGVTAGSFVPYGSNITIVDIEPMVPKFVTPQFAKENYSVIPDSVASPATRPPGYKGYDKTQVIIDDGRHFIKTTNRKFDIITSDPIDPWVKGCAALNTVEYYQMCRDHLKPGGVVALWIPLYESSNDTARSVIATFFQVFPNGIIWSNDQRGNGYDAVLYAKVGEDGGVDKPTKIDIDAMQAYIDAHPAVKQSLGDVGFASGRTAVGEPVDGSCEAVELLSTYAGTASRMKEWTKGSEDLINYDRNLRLQYVAGLHVNEFKQEEIFRGILSHYAFPDEMFTGSPERIAALKKFLAATGRSDPR